MKSLIFILFPLCAFAQQQDSSMFVATGSASFTWKTPSQVKGFLSLSNISGTWADSTRTALWNAINGKQATITTGTTSQYFRGDFSLATFPTTTASFANSTNKNFVTDAQLTIIGNTSNSNSGDNAANSTYASDYRAANFVAGTNYQVPITAGDVTTPGATATIGALKVTNGMLAGSIAASKLVGSDIATVGTITTGTWSATAIADGKIASALTGKTYNGLTVTSSTGTLTIANGKTLTANNSLTLSGTDGSTLNMGTGGTLGTNAYTSTSYQPLATNLTSIGGLANASGYLKNNGSGTFTYETPAGAGTVTDASVVSANGFAGTVATSTSTPAITISTTITGLLKGNGTAISAATAGTDYVTPTGIGMPVYAQVTGSNATTTGQALTNITGLSVALTTSATYEFEAVMSVSTSAVTTGTAYGVQYSVAGATVEAQITGASTSTASKTLRINALNSATALYLATSAQTGGVVIKGRITTGANAGNLTIQHLKLTSGTSTVFIGSFLKVIRIQ